MSVITNCIRPRSNHLEVLDDIFDQADVEACIVGLNKKLLNNAVFNNGSKSLVAMVTKDTSGIKVQIESFGKATGRIGQELDFTFVANRFTPGVHNEGVVNGNACDEINTLGLEIICLLDVAGKMALGTSRCESTGNAKEDSTLLFSKKLASVVSLGRGRSLYFHVGNTIAYLEKGS